MIAYPPKVSAHIERQYIETTIEGGARVGASAPLEITYKVANDHTGFNYSVDFTTMRQKNSGSGYQRNIRREKNQHYRAPPVEQREAVVVANHEAVAAQALQAGVAAAA